MVLSILVQSLGDADAIVRNRAAGTLLQVLSGCGFIRIQLTMGCVVGPAGVYWAGCCDGGVEEFCRGPSGCTVGALATTVQPSGSALVTQSHLVIPIRI